MTASRHYVLAAGGTGGPKNSPRPPGRALIARGQFVALGTEWSGGRTSARS